MRDETAFAAGPWRVLERLGEGHTGAVYKAVNTQRWNQHESETCIYQLVKSMCTAAPMGLHEQSVVAGELVRRMKQCMYPPADAIGALKLRKCAFDGAALARFEREADMLRRCEHRHMIRLVDTDTHHRWHVYEYMPSGSLLERRSEFAGKVAPTLGSIRGIAEALSVIHRRDMVHRDVKLRSIFVTPDRRLVLGDFGDDPSPCAIARAVTETGNPLGDRGILPPWLFADGEQVAVRPSTDVYMLGRVIYAMLSPRGSVQPGQLEEPDSDLRRLLPSSPEVELVHALLKRTIVEREEDCIPDGSALLAEIERLLRIVGPSSILAHAEMLMQNDWEALSSTRLLLREILLAAFHQMEDAAAPHTGRSLDVLLRSLATPFPPPAELRGDTMEQMSRYWPSWLARSPLWRFAEQVCAPRGASGEGDSDRLITSGRWPEFQSAVVLVSDFWNRWGRNALQTSAPGLPWIRHTFEDQKSEIVLVAYLALALASNVSTPQPDRRWLMRLAQEWWKDC